MKTKLLKIFCYSSLFLISYTSPFSQCTITGDNGCDFNSSQTMSQNSYRLVYSTPGTCTFTVPQYVTTMTVYVWGAGGGGGGGNAKGGATDFDACSGGGGGGGGGYSQKTFTVSAGQTYSIKVGAGGTGHNGTNTGTANSGESSSVTGNSHNIVANGGSGGKTVRANTSSTNNVYVGGDGGAGGTATGGDINYTGGKGANGSTGTHDRSGGGGSGAGSTGNGNDGLFVNSADPNGGKDNTRGGAAKSCNGGAGGHGRYNGSSNSTLIKVNANKGSKYGGGGGGGLIHTYNRGMNSGNGETVAGGDGEQGLVIIEFPFPLNITLENFSAFCHQNRKEITWTADNNDDISHYILERSSNGFDWTELERIYITPKNNNKEFNVLDNNIGGAITYYRLYYYNTNGNRYDLGIITSECKKENNMTVYPNPSDGITVVEISSDINFEGILNIIDLNGKNVLHKAIEVTKGVTGIHLNLLDLANGIYTIEVTDNSNNYLVPIKLILNK